MTAIQERYEAAQQSLLQGERERAEALYEELLQSDLDSGMQARILNDLGVSAILSGNESEALGRFQESLRLEATARLHTTTRPTES